MVEIGDDIGSITEERRRESELERRVKELGGRRGRLSNTLTYAEFRPPSNPTKYLLTYRCSRCSHEWGAISIRQEKTTECIMGCSYGASSPTLLGFFRAMKALFTGKEAFGYGVLIKSEKLG